MQNIMTVLRRSILLAYRVFIEPKSSQEDASRREFILNIILVGILLLLLLFDAFVLFDSLKLGSAYQGISFGVFSSIVLLFVMLFVMSRIGLVRLAAIGLLALFFFGTAGTAYRWGVDLPIVLLAFALIITIASIVINPSAGFVTAFMSAGTLIVLGHAQSTQRLIPEAWWKTTPLTMINVVEYAVVLCLIMVISWLSSREIEHSLRRARRSEAALKEERDLLELKVEERTEALKRAQLEKISHVYRFAEFGRLASGLFHDLLNPLTAVALNVRRLTGVSQDEAATAQAQVERTLQATARMEGYMRTIRRQIEHHKTKTAFSLNEEVEQVLQLLGYKARTAQVEIAFIPQEQVEVFGDPMKFQQIVANLVSNGIDAHESISQDAPRRVIVSLHKSGENIRLVVEDTGAGVPLEMQEKIFEPFFTTKSPERGIGIGLSTTKHLVQTEFSGTISLEYPSEGGARFVVEFSGSSGS